MSIEQIADRFEEKKGGFALHYLTLYSMIIGMNCQKVLEFGSGFSTVTILKALEKTGGTLSTVDPREIADTGNSPDLLHKYKNWNYIKNYSQNIYSDLKKEKFDFILHDGSHDTKRVIVDLFKISNQIKKNGIILVHDTEHPAFYLKLAIKIGLFFKRYEMVTLPYGNGLSIIRMLSNKKNGFAFQDIPKNKKFLFFKRGK